MARWINCPLLIGLCGWLSRAVAGDVISSDSYLPTEYCWQSFNASCPFHNQVVMVTAARYGRMRLGQCVTRDYYLKCSADVITQVDKRCSGRRSCEFYVPDTTLQHLQPCPKDLMAYLEADYTCITVADKGPSFQCSQNPGSSLRQEKDGYLSSLVAKETGLGGPECPWVIQVPAGQRINLTLFDFALPTSYGRSPDISNIYATIREGSGLETNVCGGERRVKNTLLSESNRIEVVMSPLVTGKKESDASIPHFLLHYKAVGCPDLSPPAGGWVRRDRDIATVACNISGERWHLACDGHVWIGEYRNCTGFSKSVQNEVINKSLNMSFQNPTGLIVAVVIGVVLGVVIGVCLLTAVLLCRTRYTTPVHNYRVCETQKPGSRSGTMPGDIHYQWPTTPGLMTYADKTSTMRMGDQYGYAQRGGATLPDAMRQSTLRSLRRLPLADQSYCGSTDHGSITMLTSANDDIIVPPSEDLLNQSSCTCTLSGMTSPSNIDTFGRPRGLRGTVVDGYPVGLDGKFNSNVYLAKE